MYWDRCHSRTLLSTWNHMRIVEAIEAFTKPTHANVPTLMVNSVWEQPEVPVPTISSHKIQTNRRVVFVHDQLFKPGYWQSGNLNLKRLATSTYYEYCELKKQNARRCYAKHSCLILSFLWCLTRHNLRKWEWTVIHIQLFSEAKTHGLR